MTFKTKTMEFFYYVFHLWNVMFYCICNIKHKIWHSRYQIMVNGWYKLCSVPNWTWCVIKFGTEIPWIIKSQMSVYLSNLSDKDKNKMIIWLNNIFLYPNILYILIRELERKQIQVLCQSVCVTRLSYQADSPLQSPP